MVVALKGALEPAIVWAAARALLHWKDQLTRRLAIRLLGGLQASQAISSRSEAANALDQIRVLLGHG